MATKSLFRNEGVTTDSVVDAKSESKQAGNREAFLEKLLQQNPDTRGVDENAVEMSDDEALARVQQLVNGADSDGVMEPELVDPADTFKDLDAVQAQRLTESNLSPLERQVAGLPVLPDGDKPAIIRDILTPPRVVFGLGKDVVGGVLDVIPEFQSTMIAIEKELEANGFPTGLYFGPEGFQTTRPGEVEDSFASQMLDMVPVIGVDEDKKHVARLLAKWTAGYLFTKRATGFVGMAGALAKAGRTGTLLNTNMNGALTAFWALGEDENFINALRGMGVDERDWFKYIDSREENSEFTNRLHNSFVDFGFAFAADGMIKIVQLIRKSRRSASGMVKASDTAAASGPAPLDLAEAQLAADTRAATIKRDEIVEILGDPTDELFTLRKVEATKSASEAAQPGLKQVDDLTPLDDETLAAAAESVAGRAATAGSIDEPLTAFYNWGKINAPEDVSRIISDTAEGFADEITRARSGGPEGVRRLKQVEMEAHEIDAIDVVMSRRATNPNARALTDSEIVAMRNLHTESARKVKEIAELYMADQTPGRLAAFSKMLSIHREVQRQFGAAKAQASRTLGALRVPKGDSGGYALVQELDQMISAGGDDLAARHIAKAIQKMKEAGRSDAIDGLIDNFPGMLALIKNGHSISEVIRTVYYFNMLSRMTTQAKNLISNSAHFALRTTELKFANMLGKAFREDGVPGVADGEASSMLLGGMKGFADSFRLGPLVRAWGDVAVGGVDDAGKRIGEALDGGFFKAFRENSSGHGLGKVDAGASGGFDPQVLGFDPESNLGRVFKVLDGVFSVPQRALVSTDEVFKTMFYRGEGQALAHRQAVSELASGALEQSQFRARVTDLAKDPTDAMMNLMERAAREGTFTQTPTGTIAGWLKAGRDVPLIGKIVLPFQQTPYNTAWEGVRRSPFGAAMPHFWKEILSDDKAVVEKAWSRYLVGNAALLTVVDTFMDNGHIRIVGENMEPLGREQRGRLGMDKLSVQFAIGEDGFEGGFWTIPIRGYEPISYIVAMAGSYIEMLSLAELDNEDPDIIDLTVGTAASLAETFINSDMISGLSNFLQALSDPEHPSTGMAAFFERPLVTMATPGATSQFTSVFDPMYREAFSLVDKIMAKTPGLSDNLPLAFDAWGRSKKRLSGWGGVMGSLSPKIVSPEEMEPIDHWLEKQNEVVRRPSKKSAGFRAGVDIDWSDHPEAYSEYVWLQGQGLKRPSTLESTVVRGAVAGTNISPPTNWFEVGVGLKDELNMLVEGKHPIMQAHFDTLGDGENGGKINFIRQAISFYRAAAREVVLDDPQFADLLTTVKQDVNRLIDAEQDPVKKSQMQVRLKIGL